MTNRLRNRARPAMTWFGGTAWRPMAWRVSDSTITMRVKLVIMISSDGATASSVRTRMTTMLWLGPLVPGSCTLMSTLPDPAEEPAPAPAVAPALAPADAPAPVPTPLVPVPTEGASAPVAAAGIDGAVTTGAVWALAGWVPAVIVTAETTATMARAAAAATFARARRETVRAERSIGGGRSGGLADRALADLVEERRPRRWQRAQGAGLERAGAVGASPDREGLDGHGLGGLGLVLDQQVVDGGLGQDLDVGLGHAEHEATVGRADEHDRAAAPERLAAHDLDRRRRGPAAAGAAPTGAPAPDALALVERPTGEGHQHQDDAEGDDEADEEGGDRDVVHRGVQPLAPS